MLIVLSALYICFGLVSSLMPTIAVDWSIVYPICYNLFFLSETRFCFLAHHFVKACKTCFLVSAFQCCGCYTLDHCIRAVPICRLILRTFYACTMFL